MDLTKGTPQVAFSSNVIVHTPAGRPKTASRRADPSDAAAARFCTPRSLRNWPSCLFFRARKSRGFTGGLSTCANAGCHTARAAKRASDFKHEGRFRSERGCKMQFLRKAAARRASARFPATSRPCTSRQTALRPLRSHTSRVAARWLAQGREREHYASNRWRCPQWLAALREASSARRR